MIDYQRTGGAWIFVPYCKLLVNISGELSYLPENMRDLIESYDFETEESGATTLTFTAYDPDFVLLNSSILTEDTAIYFEYGWANDWNNIKRFNGYISTIDVEFTDKGYPSLTITCMDETHKMNREEKTRTFRKMKRSSIAEKIFEEYGIPCRVADSGERRDDIEDEITQSRETDISFLQGLAGEVIGNVFICYVEDGVGYFCQRDLVQEPIMDFHYRDSVSNDVKSFTCSINKEKAKFYKGTGDIDPATGQPYSLRASLPSEKVKTQQDTKLVTNKKIVEDGVYPTSGKFKLYKRPVRQ